MNPDRAERIILGIDPGTSVMGYGVISTRGQQIDLLSMGSIQLGKLPDHSLRLRRIMERVTQLIESYTPDECAIEAPFFGKNVQSMLKLGRAQGVCMATVIARDIPVMEYSPSKIKQAITGSGRASKEQVAAMLQRICKFDRQPKHLDATDGLAAAVCHYFQGFAPVSDKSYGSWAAFAKANPERTKG